MFALSRDTDCIVKKFIIVIKDSNIPIKIYIFLIAILACSLLNSLCFSLIFPIFFLILYDCVFINVIYPYIIKVLMGSITITQQTIDKNFLFSNSIDLRDNTIIISIPKTIILDYQSTYIYRKIINRLENYIWLCKFYQSHAILKYYLLPFSIMFSHTIFIILVYLFYFNQSNCLYLFVFLFIWLFYTLHNIESILNIRKHSAYFKELKNNIKYRQFFSRINIIEYQNKIMHGIDPQYFANIELLYEKEYKQKIDFIIMFMSTVVFIALVTFVVSTPETNCYYKGNNNEQNVSCNAKTSNREK